MKLYVERKLWLKWQRWAELSAPNEVAALGKVQIVEPEKSDPYLLAVDLVLPEQEASGARAKISADGMGWAHYQLREVEGLTWWVHSHVNMPAFWSGIDKDGMRELAEECGGVAVATVSNLQNEHESAICHGVGALHHIQAIELEVYDAALADQAEIDARFKAAVSVAKPVAVKTEKKGADKDGEIEAWREWFDRQDGHWSAQVASLSKSESDDSADADAAFVREMSRDLKRHYRLSKRQRREILRDIQENLAYGVEHASIREDALACARVAEMDNRKHFGTEG